MGSRDNGWVEALLFRGRGLFVVFVGVFLLSCDDEWPCMSACYETLKKCGKQLADARDTCKGGCTASYPEYMACYWYCRIDDTSGDLAACLDGCERDEPEGEVAAACAVACDVSYTRDETACNEAESSCLSECEKRL